MIRVRPATPGDAPEIARVHVAAIRSLASHYTAAQIAAWTADKQPERYVAALAEGEFMVVAQRSEDGPIVGFAGGRGDEVRAVYVDPEHGRLGIGREMLAAIESDARGRGETSLRLDSSLPAVAFYLAHGYFEHERVVHRLRGGCELECVPMTKSLIAR
jgi:GNAT superfamily N-acetyltransferase